MSGSSSSNQANNMYATSGKYDNAANSQFGQNVFQAPALNQLYGQAANLYGQTAGASQGLVPGAVNQANQVAQGATAANQGNMQGGAYTPFNFGQQLSNSLQQSQNAPSASQQVYQGIMGGQGNSYLPAMRQSMLQNQANAQSLNSGRIDAQAAAAGMSGGSRQGVQEGLMRSLGNQDVTSQMNQMGLDTFERDLQNKMNIANQADTNNFGRQQLMGNLLGQQQGTINQGIQMAPQVQQTGLGGFNAANAPWQGMQAYQGALGAPTILNQGTSSSVGKGSSSGYGMGQSSGSSKSGGGGI